MDKKNLPSKKIEILYADLKNKYIIMQKKFKLVIVAFKKSRIAFKRLLKNYVILKKKYLVLRKHSNKKVMELIDRINKKEYQLMFDENRKIVNVSDSFLEEIEMNREEFAQSFYIDVLFEKYLPMPDHKSQ
jgi:hypothetical protein